MTRKQRYICEEMIIAITRCGLLTLIFLLPGCGDETQPDAPELSRYYYSNITGDDLFFTVNGKSYHLAHDAEGIVYLPSGLNKLETPQGQQISFMAYPGTAAGSSIRPVPVIIPIPFMTAIPCIHRNLIPW